MKNTNQTKSQITRRLKKEFSDLTGDIFAKDKKALEAMFNEENITLKHSKYGSFTKITKHSANGYESAYVNTSKLLNWHRIANIYLGHNKSDLINEFEYCNFKLVNFALMLFVISIIFAHILTPMSERLEYIAKGQYNSELETKIINTGEKQLSPPCAIDRPEFKIINDGKTETVTLHGYLTCANYMSQKQIEAFQYKNQNNKLFSIDKINEVESKGFEDLSNDTIVYLNRDATCNLLNSEQGTVIVANKLLPSNNGFEELPALAQFLLNKRISYKLYEIPVNSPKTTCPF